MKLSDVIDILDEAKPTGSHITTSGGKLKIKKTRILNSFAASCPCFISYLLTLLTLVLTRRLEHQTVYGYVLASMKGEHDAQWFSLSAVLEYFGVFATLVVRDSNHGGNAKGLIMAADLTLRTEMFRLND